jgi:hypothetical protein
MEHPNGSSPPARLKIWRPTRARDRTRIAAVVGLLLVAGTNPPGEAKNGLAPAPADRVNRFPGSTLSHGPLMGAVGDTGAKIWVRAQGTAPMNTVMTVQYGQLGDPAGIARSWSAPEGMDVPSYEADVSVGGRLAHGLVSPRIHGSLVGL